MIGRSLTGESAVWIQGALCLIEGGYHRGEGDRKIGTASDSLRSAGFVVI
jgi:hypothetical protein